MVFVTAAEQPITTDIKIADEVFMKTMRVQRAGTVVPQHSHAYSHVSVLVRGSVTVLANDTPLGTFHGPCGITIAAGIKHTFTTLEDDTIILCVHDVAKSDGEVAILDQHHIIGGH